MDVGNSFFLMAPNPRAQVMCMRRHLQTLSLIALATLASVRAYADTNEPTEVVSFGRLSVSEAHDAKTTVFVDGAEVGSTPWEGTLSVGQHTVTLLGEGTVGCPPTSITVAMNQITRATLIAEPLECTLRVDPSSSGASVFVDTARVGSGAWSGPLRCGAHLVAITEPGFPPFTKQIELAKDLPGSVSDRAEREAASRAGRVLVGARGAMLLSPALNSDLTGSAPLAVGGMVELSFGYRPYRALEIGVNAGYLSVSQTISGSAQQVESVGVGDQNGNSDDALTISGPTVGIHGSVQTGKTWLFGARLGAGLLFANWTDQRTNGRFLTPAPSPTRPIGSTPYSVFPMTEKGSSSYLYVAPGVQFGYRLTNHLTARVGVDLMLLAGLGSRPTFQGSTFQGGKCPLSAANDCVGVTRYTRTHVFDTVIPLVSPTVDVRYEF